MTSYTDELRRMLAELEETRRHLDDDITDLRRIIARHGTGTTNGASGAARRQQRPERHTAKGETRAEILAVMGSHPPGPWRVGEVHAQMPHKSKGSISTAMIRMVEAGLLEDAGYGLYGLPKGSSPDPGGEPSAHAPGEIFGEGG